MKKIFYTQFSSVQNPNQKDYKEYSLDAFWQAMHKLTANAVAKPKFKKQQIELFAFYKLKPNTTRSNQNVESLSAIVFDCDNESTVVRYEDLSIPWNHFYYTTFSSTDKKPKFRIIIPLDEACDAEDYEAAYWGAYKLLKEPAGFDHSARALHRAYYLPAKAPNQDFRFAIVQDEFEAVLAELIGEGIDYVYSGTADKHTAGATGRNVETVRIIGGMLERGCNESEIVNEILKVDAERAKPLFTDASERFGGKPFQMLPRMNALNLVMSVMSSVANKNPDTIEFLTPGPVIPSDTTVARVLTPTGDALCLEAPGPCGALVRAIMNYGPTSPAYALGGALTLMSAIKGRSFKSVPGNNFSNLYCILVGRSGSGKDAPLSFCNELANSLYINNSYEGLAKKLSGEQSSGAAIEDALATQKELVIVWDEIGKLFCRLLKNAGKGSAYEDQIVSSLLKYYSQVRHAHVKLKKYSHGNRERQDRPDAIAHPFLSVLGSTTTGDLCDAITGASAKDGTVARMFFLHPERDRIQSIDFDGLKRSISIEPLAFNTLLNIMRDATNATLGPMGAIDVAPVEITFSEGAVAEVKHCLKWQQEKTEALSSESLAACYARVTENALKIATAICYEREEINARWVISEQVMEWSIRLAKANLETITSVLLQNSGKPQRLTRQQELQNQIEALLRLQNMSRSDMVRACAVSATDGTFTRALKFHIESGNVKETKAIIDGSNRKQFSYQWVAQ